MAKLKKDDIDAIKKKRAASAGKDWIKVGMSACGVAAGADAAYKTLVEDAKKHGLDIKITKCGCAGMCYAEPLVEVKVDDMPQVIYGRVDAKVAVEIIEKHVIGKQLLNDHIYNVKVEM